MLRRIVCVFVACTMMIPAWASAEDIRSAVASLPDDALIALHVIVLEELANRDIGNARKQQLQLEYSRYEEHIESGIDILAKTVFCIDEIDKETNPELVWISESGTRYHTIPTCCGMKNPVEVPVSRALIKGLTPCQDCAYWLAETEE